MSSQWDIYSQQLDRLAVAEIMVRERRARDTGLYSEMASYYHPDASIEVSWFKGTGKEFIAQTAQQAAQKKANDAETQESGFHGVGAIVADVKGDRAIADCTLHNFYLLEGVACKYTGYVRMPWRFVRVENSWKIAGVRCIYLRDLTVPFNPNIVPALDEAELKTYRLSYRYLSYHLARAGLKPQNDLPGEDRPDTVATLRKGERDWLEQG